MAGAHAIRTEDPSLASEHALDLGSCAEFIATEARTELSLNLGYSHWYGMFQGREAAVPDPGRPNPRREGSRQLPCERPNLWRQASVARHAGGGCVVWTASDRAIDAATGSQSPSYSTAASRRPLPTANGLPTSRMCGRQRAGSMWLRSSICSCGVWSAGR